MGLLTPIEHITMAETGEEWTEEQAAPELATVEVDAPEIMLFGKWPLEDIECRDISLTDYLAFKDRSAVYVPHTAGRYAVRRFRKAQCPIVERLVNSLMMHGRNNGKKLLTLRIVKHTFEIIHLVSGENPVQVCVDAIVNSGAREASFRSIKSLPECLADELQNAAKNSPNSYAVRKKDELERVAKSNR